MRWRSGLVLRLDMLLLVLLLLLLHLRLWTRARRLPECRVRVLLLPRGRSLRAHLGGVAATCSLERTLASLLARPLMSSWHVRRARRRIRHTLLPSLVPKLQPRSRARLFLHPGNKHLLHLVCRTRTCPRSRFAPPRPCPSSTTTSTPTTSTSSNSRITKTLTPPMTSRRPSRQRSQRRHSRAERVARERRQGSPARSARHGPVRGRGATLQFGSLSLVVGTAEEERFRRRRARRRGGGIERGAWCEMQGCTPRGSFTSSLCTGREGRARIPGSCGLVWNALTGPSQRRECQPAVRGGPWSPSKGRACRGNGRSR